MPWLLWLSVAGIIYGALVALAQSDIKRLIAYSSVSHLGFCMLGLFALNPLGMQGGVLQMINHGLSTGGLFAVVGMLYERYHTRRDSRARRPRPPAAAAGVLHAAVHVLQHRPARAERLCRRVPAADRHVPAGLGRFAGRAGLATCAPFPCWPCSASCSAPGTCCGWCSGSSSDR